MTIAATYNIKSIIGLNTDAADAGEDLTGDERKFLAYDSNDKLVIAATQGMIVAGVLVNQPQADASDPTNQFTPEVVTKGVRIGVISGAACTRGTYATNDTAGKAIAATETDEIHGVFRTTVSGADELVMIDLDINGGSYLVADNT